MLFLAEIPVLLALLGQVAADEEARFSAEAGSRLTHMKSLVGAWNVQSAGEAGYAFRLAAEPALRFTNPVGQSRDGAVYLWLAQDDRPAAVVQVSQNRRGFWAQELSSLSEQVIRAKTAGGLAWNPTKAGVEFRPVRNSPKPGSTPEQRLVQMRTMMHDFKVEDDFQKKSWQTLRPLTKPFARYGKPGSAVTDGALFCLVLTTDPEVYMMIEVRDGQDGPAWYYAFAPSTTYPVRATWKGEVVWGKNLIEPEMGPSDTLFQLHTANGSP